MKKTALSLLVCLTACYAHAQTKVFKEVSEEISSQMKIIRQDDALVGYLVYATGKSKRRLVQLQDHHHG